MVNPSSDGTGNAIPQEQQQIVMSVPEIRRRKPPNSPKTWIESDENAIAQQEIAERDDNVNYRGRDEPPVGVRIGIFEQVIETELL